VPAPPASERREQLIALMREMQEKHECPLIASRTKLVFGAGNADADLMFVGEAPGFYEDQQGLPFVGRAGKLLDQLLVEIDLVRSDTFVTNVLKCRPPDNRDPLPEEIEVCKPYLFRQIELIEPKLVCTLGNFSLKLLTRSSAGITRVHGVPQQHELGGRRVRLYPLFHPAAALRGTAVLEQLRADFARLPALLAEPGPEQPRSEQPRPERTPEPPALDPASQLDLFG
jgi:DNA polymerase